MRDSRDIRWRPCKNIGPTNIDNDWEDIPPYSLVALFVPAWFTSIPQDGQDVLLVRRALPIDQYLQNPALLAVTGPQTIHRGEVGVCTQDWPAMVAYDRSTTSETFKTGTSCGPISGSFRPGQDGTAFTIVGHVATRPIQNDAGSGISGTTFESLTQKPGLQCIWIAPPGRAMAVNRLFMSIASQDDVASSHPIQLCSQADADAGSWNDTSRTMYVATIDKNYDSIVMKNPGVYAYGVSATLGSPDFDHGDILRMQAICSLITGVAGTGYRTAWKFEDEYANVYTSDENVAFTGTFETTSAGGIFKVLNGSGVGLTVTSMQTWVLPLTGMTSANLDDWTIPTGLGYL